MITLFPLHVRSYFSFLRGTASPAHLCALAKEYGYDGLALTDRDNLCGLWPFLAACRREGLRPVVGAEMTEPGSGRIAVCLVQNTQGYAHLCNLITRRHQSGPFSLKEEIVKVGEGLLVVSKDRLLLTELQSQGVKVAADLGAWPIEAAGRLRKWAAGAGVPAVATPDCGLADKGDVSLYCLLRAIACNTTLSRLAGAEMVDGRNWFAPPEVYQQRFAVWPEVIPASMALAEACSFTGPAFGTVMPPWQGRTDAVAVLRVEAYLGARLRYGDDLSEPVVDRLEHELGVIEAMGFSSYFLVVRDIVHRLQPDGSRRQRRICGRGSGAASLVAYCLQITNVCPIRHNLYFERFLNPGRTDPPDIDVDFAWDERDAVIADVLQEHRGHAAMVCNHIGFKPRMALRETAKVYGLPEYEISRITKRIPWFSDGPDSLQQRLSRLPSLQDQDLSPPWPEIIGLAEKLIGLPRYLSVHPGGVVITPLPICDYAPVEVAPKGVPIIQWEKDGTEEAGLVKIDLLGNRSLGVIRDCIADIKARGFPFDDMHWVPEDDSLTKNSVSQGMTMGCFYIESPAMRLLQKKAGSGDFEQLVLQSSIIRPAANEFVREYVRRLHGGAWQPLHEKVGDVLDETFGLMVYQEDVSKVAVSLAGFTHARADGLRKVLSKKDRELRLGDYKDEFFAGCRSRGVGEQDIETIWKMMMSFDGYSFCKPHSASYARVSYQAAYLKSHFPAEFMAAVISNRGGYYSTFSYVSETKRLGVEIVPPDVNRSDRAWRGLGTQVLVGLQAIRGVSDICMEKIIDCRDKKLFTSVADFLCRVRPAEDEARVLIHAGALDSLSTKNNRAALLWELACFHRGQSSTKVLSLFDLVLPEPPSLPVPDRLEQLRREYEALGFLCRAHPLSFFVKIGKGLTTAHALPGCSGRRVRFAGWLLTGKLVSTKTGEVMEFLTFEDETGMVEATFFPGVYRRYAHLLTSGRPYLLTGLVEQDFGAVTLTVDSVEIMKGVRIR
jgi:DNA-directed DNA polymerase III PolC